MRGIKPAVWAPLLSLALVVWFVWHDTRQVGPGPLSAAHAQDPELDEQDCEVCHGEKGAGTAGMARACTHCHEEIGAQLAGKSGLHGMIPGDATRCGACHSEHHGRELALVSGAAFERAGVRDVVHYDHAGLGFTLGGKHLDLDCIECHENSDVRALEKGKLRFLGKSQACASCHKDPHAGRLPDCKSCHGEERPFPEAPNFRHTERFPLAGAHAGLACVRCHTTPGQYKGAVGTCSSCHESPHAASFLAQQPSCERCHPVQAAGFAREGVVFPKEWHAFSGFELAAPHDKQECAQCHAAGLTYREAHPGRKLENCAACHEDVHKGQFGARGCRECHSGAAWKPALFDATAHARTDFPLEGRHAAAKCAACHQERFAGTPRECASCHQDVHKGPIHRHSFLFFFAPIKR